MRAPNIARCGPVDDP